MTMGPKGNSDDVLVDRDGNEWIIWEFLMLLKFIIRHIKFNMICFN